VTRLPSTPLRGPGELAADVLPAEGMAVPALEQKRPPRGLVLRVDLGQQPRGNPHQALHVALGPHQAHPGSIAVQAHLVATHCQELRDAGVGRVQGPGHQAHPQGQRLQQQPTLLGRDDPDLRLRLLRPLQAVQGGL